MECVAPRAFMAGNMYEACSGRGSTTPDLMFLRLAIPKVGVRVRITRNSTQSITTCINVYTKLDIY